MCERGGGWQSPLNHIRRKVNEGRSRPAVPCGAVCIADRIWYCVEGGRTKCDLGVGSEKGNGIKLLKGAFGSEVCLR